MRSPLNTYSIHLLQRERSDGTVETSVNALERVLRDARTKKENEERRKKNEEREEESEKVRTVATSS